MVGAYVANVKFHKEVETEVAFEVISEDAPVAEAAPAEAPVAE